MAIYITRDDVLNFMDNHEQGPLPSPSFRRDESGWLDWLMFEAPEYFVKQNPEAVLEAVLDIAFHPPDLSSKQYFSDPGSDPRNDIEVEGGDLLAACSKTVPDLFIHKMNELLPLAEKEVTRCILFWGLSESCLPQSFELLKSLMPATTEYNNAELVSFIDSLGGLGLHLKREQEALMLLCQIQDSTAPHRVEVHKELAVFLEELEKAK